MRLLISMKVLIISYQIWLYPKILDLTLISVHDGYIAAVAYEIYQAKDYFWSVIDGQIINHHSSSDQKRSNPIFKKFKIFGACRKSRKRFLDHNLMIIYF